ncbi:hypothetical protein SDC9_150961 [bioreactor metagenome]|uniref:DUF3796 domain-containing protein n=1 Tax=bioreactor metagenome TaxID=1076179 RepID=A0A645ERF6_9ZZZZ
MKVNALGFLSLLTLLGVLGLFLHKPMLGFFGFAYYIRYFFITADELFQQNVRRAASLGFFSGVAATGISLALSILFPAIMPGNAALASCYVVSVFCFTLALLYFEVKEQAGA